MSTTLDITIAWKNLEKIICRPKLHFKEVVRQNNEISLHGFLF